MNAREIKDLFHKHGIEVSRDDIWEVNSKPVILHAALERLGAALELEWDMPTIVTALSDEVVLIVRAKRKDGKSEWSFGEVKIVKEGAVGGNYKVTGKQPGYPYAMAEKRAKDRVIIKLADLHGAYSDEEADDFKNRGDSRSDPEDARLGRGQASDQERPARRSRESRAEANPTPSTDPRTEPAAQEGIVDDAVADEPKQEVAPPPKDDPDQVVAKMIAAVEGLDTTNKIVAWMTNKKVLATFAELGSERTDVVKNFGRERMEAIRKAALAARQAASAASSGASAEAS